MATYKDQIVDLKKKLKKYPVGMGSCSKIIVNAKAMIAIIKNKPSQNACEFK